jgi:putative membrane protein
MMGLVPALHDGSPLAPHDLWRAWSVEPGVLLCLGLGAILYARGAARLGQRSPRAARGVRIRAVAFVAGWLLLLVALVSPLHRLGGALVSAHMAQHEILMVVAAPLLVLSRPLIISLWAFSSGGRRRLGTAVAALAPLGRWLGRIEVAWLLHAVAIIAWHAPRLYDRTVTSDFVHSLQHASFLGTALLFWWSVLTEARLRRRHGGAVLSLFTTSVYTAGLGALLAVAPSPWYAAYGAAAPAWDLTPLEDQQLAGLIMWIPAGASYLLACLWLVSAWLRDSETIVVRRERLRRGAVALPLVLALILLGGCDRQQGLSTAESARITGGDPVRGRAEFRERGCGACHTVGGVPGAKGRVGPPLDGLRSRSYVAGVLTNTPANLIRWIESPHEVDSLTAMPDVGLSLQQARDIAAFLYTRP